MTASTCFVQLSPNRERQYFPGAANTSVCLTVAADAGDPAPVIPAFRRLLNHGQLRLQKVHHTGHGLRGGIASRGQLTGTNRYWSSRYSNSADLSVSSPDY